ncbi:MAG TPA: hypothetical protein DET40_25465 [Lentisphaeria bacterium]|nr:MAG: hypothetical protein A2X45_18500 [Lentisphaerae bacterium GWF2_50_93]HCE46910.1 hypothetical protein [Lentisphaeria bacterium]
MPKKIADNQDYGISGEDQFAYWASSVMHWYTTKPHDFGFDFICQIRGKRINDASCEMPGSILNVSVRSTDNNLDYINIKRSDAELFLTSNNPAALALVGRAPHGQIGKVAIRVPDDRFVSEIDEFLAQTQQTLRVYFKDALTDAQEIKQAVDNLCRQWYVHAIQRSRIKSRLKGVLPDPQVEFVNTEAGGYTVLRSKQFAVPVDITKFPKITEVIQDIRDTFKVILQPIQSSDHIESTFIEYKDIVQYEQSQYGINKATFQRITNEPLRILSFICQELAVWNYDRALLLCESLESSLASESTTGRPYPLSTYILLSRVHAVQAEMKRPDAKKHIDRAKSLLSQAEEILSTDSEQKAEVMALRASIESLEKDPEAGLSMLEGRNDPYAIRTRTALLLSQRKYPEAMAAVDGKELHERWCDMAVVAYVMNDKLEKAQEIVRWAASLHDRSKLPQCIVKLADALMNKVFSRFDKDTGITPNNISDDEKKMLEAALEELQTVLQNIRLAKAPSSELDMAALRMGWNANYLLQRREKAGEMLSLMNAWTPVPIEVAKGVLLDYLEPPPGLPDRIRCDHPGDLEANLLACGIQSASLEQNRETFLKAKDLLSLADDEKKKEGLFRLLLQLWQNLEGADVTECEKIAEPLVVHNLKLHTIFAASTALRRGDVDSAIASLDGEKSPEDPHWLQLRANAFLIKKQLGDAAKMFLTAAEIANDPGLILKAGDIAFQAKMYDVAARCYERLVEMQPDNVVVLNNLAHIYTFILDDFEKAAVQFKALHAIDPDEQTYTLNLAICLARIFRPEESLSLYDELCKLENPQLQAIIGRTQLYHSLGNTDAAMNSLIPFRERFWADSSYLMEYMSAAYAAGRDDLANDAFTELNRLREAGTVGKDTFKAIKTDEALEMFKQMHKQTREQSENVHNEMIKGRMPWAWAAQVSKKTVLDEWLFRTQEMTWIGDDPANLASFCIYSTNGFHPRTSEDGKRELPPLACPPPGSKIVADISALITLHRLGLLDVAAEYFAEIMVPAGYLSTVLEDSKRMVHHQRSRRDSAEQIKKLVNSKRIMVLPDKSDTKLPVVDEHGEGTDHHYRLIDIVKQVRAAGKLSDVEYENIFKICAKRSGIDDTHPALHELQEVLLELSTLETLTDYKLLGPASKYFRIYLRAKDNDELIQRLEALAYQEETRSWHIELWSRLRSNARFRFVPHPVPEQLREKSEDAKDYLPFLANFIAKETGTPLLADDRVCQMFTLNEMQDSPNVAFGSDKLILALMDSGRLTPEKATECFRQLMAWRYRFIIPTAELLKALADQYRENPPGKALQEVAVYFHDCMRDAGLFSGRETEYGESMSVRFFLACLTSVAEFLVLIWADDKFEDKTATSLTEWCVREMIPSLPYGISAPEKTKLGAFTNRLFLSHVLLKTGSQFGKIRIADGMKTIKETLRISNDEYTQIITQILNDTARTTAQP